jgi:CTP:molybdopterin cytidylyltransferase MocA
MALGPKQLLPFDDRTVLETVIETVLAAPINGLVVVTHTSVADELDLAEDPRFITVINEDAESQMLDSIRLGIEAIRTRCEPPPEAGILVCPGDMPKIGLEAMTTCVETFHNRNDVIVVATHQDKRGHPIIVPMSMTDELSGIREGGLAELLRRYPERVYPVECDEPGVCRDIDTPEDYEDVARS